MVADIVVGDLVDFVAANARARSHEIYRHQARLLDRKTAAHSVLVVGIDVTSEDRIGHYAEVKNTWGTHYGDEGFTRVGFEVLRKIWWPAPAEDGGPLYGINP
ncbi:transducin/WD40 repeat-like superfamily protein [Tanacetum coccineum]